MIGMDGKQELLYTDCVMPSVNKSAIVLEASSMTGNITDYQMWDRALTGESTYRGENPERMAKG